MTTLLRPQLVDLPVVLMERGIEVRVHDDWIRTAMPAPALPPRELLRAAADLPSRLRYSLDPAGKPRISADLIFGVDDTVRDWEGVLAAFGGTAGVGRGSEPAVAPECGADAIPQLFLEAGWVDLHPRRQGWSLSLDTPPGVPAARVSCESGGLCLAVELPLPETFGEKACAALSMFLLATTDAVRLVRAAWPDGRQPRFEFRFSALPSPAQLRHVLGALSTAATLCAGECLALGDENVARVFLAMRGLPSEALASPQTGGNQHDHA